MENKKIAAAAAIMFAAASALHAQTPAGNVAYSLQRTVINFEVTASAEHFTAGPYARFAQKFLSVDAGEQDRTTWTVTSVDMSTSVEDDSKARYSVPGGKGTVVPEASVKDTRAQYRSSAADEAGFDRIPYTEAVLGVATLEGKAAEAANLIMQLRRTRVQIVTGDTDATYSGEAMQAALSQIDRLEAEYLSLFLGRTTEETRTISYCVCPDALKENQQYVAFRLSGTDGLLDADDNAGTPYILEIVPEPVAETVPSPAGKVNLKGEVLYRVPAPCALRLTDGVSLLLQTRADILQLGSVEKMPIYNTK